MVQCLFFNKLLITKTQLNSCLPKHKQSLSIAIRLICLLVGSLKASTNKPSSIHNSDSDHIAIIVDTCFGNFYELSS
ncbi:hypothetical protein HPP92_020219 [Vanilla planifolia]|uniref:Uncharacterized protein n=2 Tax=Vanilla planifolia TaxID=51239 RepID=A0A835Q4B4_VANPL|nr:hypothetical protein HPP92_020219 [Vanilla planifolia]